MSLLFFYGLLFISALLLTGLIRRHAVLDIPNERSSHQQPTPRGGGLAFVIIFCFALLTGHYWQLIASNFTFACLIACLLVALLGFIDDKKGLPALFRLTGHFAAAAIALSLIGDLPVNVFFNATSSNKAIVCVFLLFYLVWLLNLFNFMDGIDGLAASEALFSCIAAALLYYFQGNLGIIYLPMSLALAVAGFLWWNFPPAKIFMGDVGSGFLGFLLGLLALQASLINPLYFWSWIILLGVFIVDATLTLIARGFRGAPVWQAHCHHAYQHAARYYKSHRQVTAAVWIINIVWLFPWAFVVSQGIVSPLLAVMSAFLPLILLAIRFKAGKAE